MLVRKARETDLPRLQELRRRRGYPGSILYNETIYYQRALQQLGECLGRMGELQDWRLFVVEEQGEAAAYLLFVVDERHGITQQLQARVVDFAVFRLEHLSALLERTVRLVKAFENQYLVVDLLARDQRIQLWFYRLGFRAELKRSVKVIAQGHRGASSTEFILRRVQPGDLPSILEIHTAYLPVYLPAGREVDLRSVELYYQLTYLNLNLDGSDGAHYLLMEERASGAIAGYLFLKPGLTLGETESFYMYDIAVAPAFARRGLSEYLVGAAETLTGQKGGFLYGDGSLVTPLISSWHAQMGAIHDSTLYGLDCR